MGVKDLNYFTIPGKWYSLTAVLVLATHSTAGQLKCHLTKLTPSLTQRSSSVSSFVSFLHLLRFVCPVFCLWETTASHSVDTWEASKGFCPAFLPCPYSSVYYHCVLGRGLMGTSWWVIHNASPYATFKNSLKLQLLSCFCL